MHTASSLKPSRRSPIATEAYISTYTGLKFHFLDPKPEEICIEDIAYALSNTVRWGGHCDPAITVAQHCVIVSRLLRNAGCNHTVQLQGLLHDACEAYIPDIPTPIKPFLKNFHEIEAFIEKVVFAKYQISYPFDPMVKLMDVESYKWEARDLMMGNHPPPQVPYAPLQVWKAKEAESVFLEVFDSLMEIINDV